MPTVHEWKGQATPPTPLFLFECKLRDGSTERWSTHTVAPGGTAYAARVLTHDAFDLRSLSADGIDGTGQVSLSLANADSYFSQKERSTGFRGARLTVRFAFFDLGTGTAQSEVRTVFEGSGGTCEELTETTARIRFVNRLSLQRVVLPELSIQRRCLWSFPSNAAERQEALTGGERGAYSPLYRCGYSAGESGGRGNLNGGSPYTSCDYSRAACEARGMFDRDGANQPTRRFSGIEFVPQTILVRTQGEKGSHSSPLLENEARYDDVAPLVYGTAWYQPPVVFARNDGNLTRMEVLLGAGEIEDVVKVVVSNVEIPEGQTGANMTATGWYQVVTRGSREGAFNPNFTNATGVPLGDPYGSMAMLSIVVPNRINGGDRLPRVEVLARGLKLPQFDQAGTPAGLSFTNNPAWVLLDVLRRSGWKAGEIDLGSFAKAAQYLGELITVQDLNGNPATAPRYQCNLVVRKRTAAADLVRGIRAASATMLTFGSDGKLQLRVETTLAEQQPVKAEGSNSAELLDGGWPAYEFSDQAPVSGILRRENGEPAIRLYARPTAESANRFSVEFQDEFNEYQQDSLSLIDIEDAGLAGHETSVALAALGIANFDQAARVLRLRLDKGIRGNTFVDFVTTVRGFGLTPGDLIAVTYAKEGLARQPFRVVQVTPGVNHETTRVLAQWHDDAWYAGGGIGERGGRGDRVRSRLPRPLLGSLVDAQGEDQFGIVESESSGGILLRVAFTAPEKPGAKGVAAPVVSLNPTVGATDGSLAGGQTLYYAVSGLDAAGGEGPLSFSVRARIPAGTNTNRVTLTGLSFSPGAAGFRVYRGSSPSHLRRIATAPAAATQFMDDGSGATTLALPPDENYDHANFYWRFELQPAAAATIHSETTVGNATLAMLPANYVGQRVRIQRGKGKGQERTISANTASTVTVAPAWDLEPDATSEFVVAEAGWRFGALSETSPLEFEVPARVGSMVQVLGRSANARDAESAAELAPVTRWALGGGAGENGVPEAPFFGLQAKGSGMVDLAGVGFADLANTRTVTAGTLSLYYWDELQSPTAVTLAGAMDPAATTLTLAAPRPAEAGELIQIGAEILRVDAVQGGGLTYVVTRGSHGSAAAAHAAGTPVYPLQRKITILSFPRDFFGSQASGSFHYPVALPDARIGAAELFVTNAFGHSDPTRAAFTQTVDQGMRTLSGGQLSLEVQGYLAAQLDATPPLAVERGHAARDVFALVREAPTGGPLVLKVRQGTAEYCTLTVAAGDTVSNVVSGFGKAPLSVATPVSLDVVSVPAGANTLPGRDLAVVIRR